MWLLHLLPLPLLARIGEAFGSLLYVFAVPRRRVCLLNLARCFPELP
jgi:KDO2-lipid IV(A) lauroyltransferase